MKKSNTFIEFACECGRNINREKNAIQIQFLKYALSTRCVLCCNVTGNTRFQGRSSLLHTYIEC